MQSAIWRVGVRQLAPNVRATATIATATAVSRLQLKVHKQGQTDVLCRLRKSCVSKAQLAPKSTRAADNNKQLCRHTHTHPSIHTSGRAVSAAQYSRYSASTIMNSYCKELDLMGYDIVGFDLDGTLLRYNLQEMTPLIYNVLKVYLVEQKGYSPALLTKKLDMDFLQKGLMLDGPRGNVLKLSNEAVILRASHGTRLLSDDEIVAAYGAARRWDVATAFYNDPLSTWNGPAATQMRTLLDYFDMPSALVFAQAVDIVDKDSGPNGRPKEYNVWRDLLDGLMHNYSRDNFKNDQSLYFKAMRAEPHRYVLPSSSKLRTWLQQLRATGKKVFLLTGSNIDFADLTATQALGPDWQQQFDYIVTYAKKPGFFTMQRPFMRVDDVAKCELPATELSLQAELKPGDVYSQGNWHQLHQSMAKQLNKDISAARALYFGDNIIQDIYTPVKHRDFDTVAIAEELFLLEQTDYPYRAVLASKFWDSYFISGNTPTLWSGFIANYAQICVSSMEQMAQTAPTERLVCNNVNGFYPALPKQLECSNLTTCWHGGGV
ncbi:5'-nucleotidase domain-containing protein 1 [Drosophila novamexicana]|uniref:5'-nucleotidase domain-containing protein 1 n=1 Tax=Drosophila novamexicana TaxID=47314 RepID=UPI0011E5C05F|nr:5'-nucleotidase domain-containing protein 1 [Drosophila novamexicana]